MNPTFASYQELGATIRELLAAGFLEPFDLTDDDCRLSLTDAGRRALDEIRRGRAAGGAR